MQIVRSHISVMAAALVLGSCAATDCDPTRGGFIGGIRCDASGGYDARIKAREDQHAALLTRRAELIREQQQVETEHQRARSELQKKQAEQQKAEADLATVKNQLAGARKDDAALQQKAKALEDDIAMAEKDLDDLAQTEQRKRLRLRELETEQNALDAEYEAAIGAR